MPTLHVHWGKTPRGDGWDDEEPDVIVWVSVAELEASFRLGDQYVGPGGTGHGQPGRYRNIGRRFLSGQGMYMPHVSVDEAGQILFSDGRHRFSWVRDHGAKAIPVTASPRHSGEIWRRFGTAHMRCVVTIADSERAGEDADGVAPLGRMSLDLLPIEAVLSSNDLQILLTALRAAEARPATIIDPTPGGKIMPEVRRSRRLDLDLATEALIRTRLGALRPLLEGHFGQTLGELETPQALHYRAGDYFVAHQDGNTPLIHDHSRYRRVSLSLLLSGPDDYAGGDLVFHDGDARHTAPVAAGDAVAFRAETTHEVLPLERGERYSIAAWWLAPEA